jgi:hypothetical protein
MTIAIKVRKPHLNRKPIAGGRIRRLVSWGSVDWGVIFSTAEGFILYPSARAKMLNFSGYDLSVRGRHQYYPRQCAEESGQF